MIKFIPSIVLMCWAFNSNAQTIYFNKLYGKNTRAEAGFGITSIDSNYYITGLSTLANSILPISAQTICINQKGDTIWTRQDFLNNPFGNDIEQLNNDAVYEIGNADFPTNQTFCLKKLKPNGDSVWTKYYRFRVYDFGMYLIPTHDSGLVIVGTISTDTSEADYTGLNNKSFIIKIDSNGNILWIDSSLVNTYGNSAYSGVETKDHSFTIVGWYNVPYSGNLFTNINNALVFKIDSNGNLLWYKTYNSDFGIGDEIPWCIIQTLDDGYLVGGYASEGIMNPNNAFTEYYGNSVMKIDSNGNMQWQKTYGGDTLDNWGFRQIRRTLDGNYILIAPLQEYNVDTNFACILKIDSAGNELFERKITSNDNSGYNVAYDILTTPDSGFIFVGSGFDTTQRVWVVKIDKYGCDSVGCQLATGIAQIETENSSFNIYPNPALSQTTVLYSVPESTQQVNLFIYDITGRTIKQLPLDKYSNQATLDVSDFPAGMYLVELKTDNGSVVKKLVVE